MLSTATGSPADGRKYKTRESNRAPPSHQLNLANQTRNSNAFRCLSIVSTGEDAENGRHIGGGELGKDKRDEREWVMTVEEWNEVLGIAERDLYYGHGDDYMNKLADTLQVVVQNGDLRSQTQAQSAFARDYPHLDSHADPHLHGVGEVLIFVNLAKYIQNERPFYAFRARGFEPRQPFFGSMDEMVSSYVVAVKWTQLHGPYAIAGYSYGCVVAFEVAKRLVAMGDEVRFTGLINSPPHIADRMHEIDWTGADAREAHHCVDIAGLLIECGKTYEPSGSVSSVDVFYAIPLRGSKEDCGEPSYTDVPGEHYTLMDVGYSCATPRTRT
ncbi:alpha/beta-hydrolase [Imleria badia]|nr:alpha/beta-hydrolase [Imleria badia]